MQAKYQQLSEGLTTQTKKAFLFIALFLTGFLFSAFLSPEATSDTDLSSLSETGTIPDFSDRKKLKTTLISGHSPMAEFASEEIEIITR